MDEADRRGVAPGRRNSDARRRATDAEREAQRRGREFNDREARILDLVGKGYSQTEIVEMLQASRRGDDPPRPRGQAPAPEGARQTASVAVAGLAFVAILLARLIFGQDADPLLGLMVVPVAALAAGFETAGGLVGAAIAAVLVAVFALADDYPVEDLVVAVGVFTFTGIVVGRLAASRNALRNNLDAANRGAASAG